MSMADCDVLIVGGGMVGLCFARLLKSSLGPNDLRITVLDHSAPTAPGDKFGLRVSALSPASRAILAGCDAWDSMPSSRIGPYRRMEVWRDSAVDPTQRISFDAAEHGVGALGYIVENDLLRYFLWQSAAEARIDFVVGSELKAIHQDPERLELELADRSISAALLVGADGAASWVRNAMGMKQRRRSYGQLGLVTHVSTQRPHQHTAWQRFLPRGPVALLPLADGRCSVVWSCPEEQAKDLLQAGLGPLSQALSDATQDVLGELQATETARAFPLAAAHADRYVTERCALIGDAAHQVHPLAGQGVNLGLRDAAVLADELSRHLTKPGADLGDLRVLRRYQRRRKGDNLATLMTMDLLQRVFGEGHEVAAALGGRGLGLVQRLPPLKRRLADHALGYAGRSLAQ